MAKTRVYELARELGRESKDVLSRARELGIEVKTASSGLDEDAAALVRSSYDDEKPSVVEEPSIAAEPPAVSSEPAKDEDGDSEPSDDEDELSQADGGDDEEKVLLVEPGITVHDLARMIQIRTAEIVKTLMFMGEMVPGGGEIPVAAIEPLGRELGWELLVAESDEEEAKKKLLK